MPTQAPPDGARAHYALSALLAQRTASAAAQARPQGLLAVLAALVRGQIAGAVLAERAIRTMLTEQGIEAPSEARLIPPAFTTPPDRFEAMVVAATDDTDEWMAKFAASLLEDSMRAAESVSVAVRPGIAHVRYVNPPCCARCAVLAGRVYRWSDGFQRHPGCDCVMVPTTVANPARQNPDDLVSDGLVRGLSKDDLRALRDGADLGRVVNTRLRSAGLRESGRVIARNGQLTPAGIYRLASDQDEAIELLRRYGYVRT